jgi:hypothetical protein
MCFVCVFCVCLCASVCVCVRARARVCVCARVCVRAFAIYQRLIQLVDFHEILYEYNRNFFMQRNPNVN